MKKIIVSLAVVLLLATTLPAFASSGKTVTVTNYDDLYMAVSSASDGDTIIIADVIPIEWSIFLGDSSKTITLKRSGNGCIEIRNDSGEYWNIFFVNVIFDCQGVDADQFIVNHAENVDVFMEGCTYKNTGTSETPEPTESSETPASTETQEPTEPTEPTASEDDSKEEQTDPDDKVTEEIAKKEDNETKDTGTTVTPSKTEDDSSTQQAPNKADEGTTVAPENVVNADNSSSMEKAPQTSESVSTDDDKTGSDSSVQNISVQNAPVENVPVTVTVEAGEAQHVADGMTTVNVNEQPVTLPDGSGTVTINIYVDSSKEQPESGQAVKSESLTDYSETQTDSGVDAVEVVQTILLASVLVCLIYVIRNRKKID